MIGEFILVVDDDDDIRGTLHDLLADEGYAVHVAGNGRDALDVLRSCGKPCLMLLDLMMPVMDGFAVLDELGRDRTLPPANVVVMTAGSTRSGELGGVPLLQKPIDLDRLLELVARGCA